MSVLGTTKLRPEELWDMHFQVMVKLHIQEIRQSKPGSFTTRIFEQGVAEKQFESGDKGKSKAAVCRDSVLKASPTRPIEAMSWLRIMGHYAHHSEQISKGQARQWHRGDQDAVQETLVGWRLTLRLVFSG